jgi:hypothetical protein
MNKEKHFDEKNGNRSNKSPNQSSELSPEMLEFLEKEGLVSFIRATFDAGREVGVKEEELKLQDDLEAEIQEIIDAARKAGISNYTREDAVKALVQEEWHNKL